MIYEPSKTRTFAMQNVLSLSQRLVGMEESPGNTEHPAS